MRWLWSERWLWALAGLVAIGLLAVPLTCWRYGIWGREDYRTYQEVLRYPPGQDLWFGRVQAAESLEALVAAHPPHVTLRLGPFVWLKYYTVWPTPPGSV